MTTIKGSGLFTKAMTLHPHLLQGHGTSGEVGDLRKDVANELSPMAAMTVEEFTAPAASDTAGLLAATASTVATQTITSFLAGGVATLAARPRTIKFTTAGGTPADAPATVVVTGKDLHGNVMSETVTIAQTAASAETVKTYASLTSVAYAAGDGTGATVAIGIGVAVGLWKKIKFRAGATHPVQEIANAVVVATGTFVSAATALPNGSYTPATAFDGAKNYALYYEYDPTAP
jgi:hypothetical protein